MGAILAGLLTVGLFLGPLIARFVFDRRADRADALGAEIRGAVRHRLGGESMVSVQVQPQGLWTRGRILLSAPTAYETLIDKVLPVVVKAIPVGYELVVRPAPRRAAPVAEQTPRLPRAA